MALLARGEIVEAESKLHEIEDMIVIALTPRDSVDERGIVLEVRAGTGNLEIRTSWYQTNNNLYVIVGENDSFICFI